MQYNNLSGYAGRLRQPFLPISVPSNDAKTYDLQLIVWSEPTDLHFSCHATLSPLLASAQEGGAIVMRLVW